ncbi:NAD(P)H-dependent flavin oxidoreductase [Congregibacter litoralis]|uniref:Dioxygenase n=1 Tax=Congregibacter litoralis KT71 TaxID=314285 RepID=A4A360_9GAMM|nr:nitronate monooxygenase [Congregibacter litoralis]EAQ99127.2 Dioxygenase [Congregibacter litoralis KT71]
MTSDPFQKLRLPVFCAPMFLVSGPEMVIAACKAGIAGSFPSTNTRSIEELEQWMARICEARSDADAPWVMNLITHSSYTRLDEELELVAKYKPAAVITALGSPKPVMSTVKAYGGLVFADVINLKLARKAAEAGVDGLACISAGAGGHTGELSPFAFISAVREFFDGYIAVGGGICDGAGVAGAIAAGADYVYMGTRFLPTRESMAHEAYKEMIIAADSEDLVVSAAITGTRASWLKASVAKAGIDLDNAGSMPRDYSGTEASKRWRDIWAAGQGVGRSRRIEALADIVDDLETEYRDAIARFQRLTKA